MDIEDIACSLLRQHRTNDYKLAVWLNKIIENRGFQGLFREWQVNPSKPIKQRRIDIALYALACEIVWFRERDRCVEKGLSEAVAVFHLKITEALKKAELSQRLMWKWRKQRKQRK